MKAVIDTSSLISFVRYYLPFDKDNKLKDFLEQQILEKKIVVLDKVAEECEYCSHSLVISALPFINNNKYKTSTSSLFAPPKFHNLIDNNFINSSERNRLGEAEYQAERDRFLKSTDCNLILYAFVNNPTEETIIITEETGYNNDGKSFKKIPENCKSIGITTLSLPKFLEANGVIDFSINVTATTLF
ncbi:MAG: DUF4411 family protein [Candidatus Cryptobacteroides sp.]|jgi:hypothetical protein